MSQAAMHRDPPHYLRALKTTTTPKRLLWLDCEASSRQEQGLIVDRFAYGALGRTWWTSKRSERRDTLQSFEHPGEMWQAASDFARPGKRVVLFAHDLAYQLRVSQGLVHLPAQGWRLDKIVLERTAAWALFRQGNRTLMCCDLKSWAPVELDRLRDDLEASHTIDTLGRRSAYGLGAGALWRALIVREATLQILGWLEAQSLGPFRPTGSGQSYAGFRRRFHHHNILVHDDVRRLELERQAMWTGRCEAWRHGTLTEGPFVEYDLRAAYCMIAAESHLPAIAAAAMSRPSLERLETAMSQGALLAEVEVETDVPIVPTRLGERTVWPVGRFRTVLWDPELRLALQYARSVRCSRALRYHSAPVLADFARWVLGRLDSQSADTPLVCRRVLKHWSRCLVGRLGLRYRQWQRFGTCPQADLRLVTYIDIDEGTATDLLCAGHERLILAEMSEALESLPQIPGWVMAECRARLWEAMARAGLEHVVYVDTDSIIIDPGAQRPGRLPLTNGSAHRWSQKGRYDRLTIHGPRNLVLHDTRRVSGLPLTARQTAPLEFTGQVMRSIKESMRAGELDHVAQIPRRFVLDAPDLRRQHLPGGFTEPYRVNPKEA